MHTTGRPILLVSFTLIQLAAGSIEAGQDVGSSPTATPTPGIADGLSGYAARTPLDLSRFGLSAGSIIITSETVDEFSSDGHLTVGFPSDRAMRALPQRSTPEAATDSQRIEQAWRARVLKQKDRVADVQAELDILEAKITALKSTPTVGRRGAARRQAVLSEMKGLRGGAQLVPLTPLSAGHPRTTMTSR
jgi:hypothetical protein